MVRVNNKEVDVFLLDTVDTFINRVAVSLNTLGKYLYFPGGDITIDDINSDKNLEVVDISDVILNMAYEPFLNIYEKIKPMIKDKPDDFIEDVLSIYLNIQNIDEQYADLVLLDIESTTQGILDVNLSDVYKHRITRHVKRLESIEKLANDVSSADAFFREFEGSVPVMKSTSFDVNYINFEVVAETNDNSLLDTFNSVKLNKNVPFASTGSFYKILKDFIPDAKWQFSEGGVIIFYTLQRESNLNSTSVDFNPVVLEFVSDGGFLRAKSELTISKLNIGISGFIERMFGVLPVTKIHKHVTTSLKGVFYYPNYRINIQVLSDLVMNNSYFSSLMYIDERKQATKMKSNIFIHFYHPTTGYVTATILTKVVEKTDQDIRRYKDRGLFEIGSSYVRVMISSATDEKSVEEFKVIMGKLMSVYDKEYRGIVDYYQTFIRDFGKVDNLKPPEPIPKTLENIEPRLFLPNYTRKCGNPPTIISDEQAQVEGRKIMEFPKDDSIIERRKYICEYENEKFPGLRDNPLSNSNIFPYIPCCYKYDQSERRGSRYRRYFFDEVIEPKIKIRQAVFLTGKIIPHGGLGTLPENISIMFKMFDRDCIYMRKGVDQNESSFLSCVLQALDENSGIKNANEVERLAIINRTRLKLATKELAAACQQEMYDYTIEEIVEMIKNPSVYFDPKLFIHMLEVYYNCNIYLFSRDTTNGEMVLPRHVQAYYKKREYLPVIMILEHPGSEANINIKYNQCELICRVSNDKNNTDEVFLHDSPISLEVSKVYERLRKSYSYNVLNEQSIFNLKYGEIIGQRTDSYGKTRVLFIRVTHGSEIKQLCLLTTPLQPFGVEELSPERSNVFRAEYEVATKFAYESGIKLTNQVVEDGVVKQVTGYLGNVLVSIPIEDSSYIDSSLEVTYGSLDYPITYESRLHKFNMSKKYARYIMEYMFWLYSNFIETEKMEISEESMLKFVKKRIVVLENFRYGPVYKTFSLMSGVMTESEGISKLAVNSAETLKSMLYSLRLMAKRDKGGLLGYRKRTSILKYYVDISDMDQHSFQVILEGSESVMKWIEESNRKYNLCDSVHTSSCKPYFFKNKATGDVIYLMQQARCLEQAVNISKIWREENYNSGINTSSEGSGLSYILYAYVDTNKIKSFNINREEDGGEIKVMGLKIDNEEVYLAMLPTRS